MFIEELVTALNAGGVRYAVVGGVAVNLLPRMTYDIDIVVGTAETNLAACKTALNGLGLRCQLPLDLASLSALEPREELESVRNLTAVTFTDPSNPLREVDVLIGPSDGVAERAIVVRSGDIELKVAAINDLIAMKRRAGREQDIKDAEHLERWSAAVASDPPDGFSYEVSDEMVERFAKSTIRQRLEWLEEMRTFTWNAASEETRKRWRAMRAHRPRRDLE